MEDKDPHTWTRRQFLAGMAGAGAITLAPTVHASGLAAPSHKRKSASPLEEQGPMAINIRRVNSNFEREPLAHAYGFKGGYLTELWQTVALMESSSGASAIGLGTQSVLWADASVFAGHTESGGNALMYALTEYALQRAEGMSFNTPIGLQERILDDVHAYGKALTGNPDLKETFVLNSLVAVDNAAWLLYAQENGIEDFDEMIPAAYRAGLAYRHDRVASIPAFGYGTPVEEIVDAVEEGYYFLKIKIGHPGTQEEMLEKDKEWLSAIHEALGGEHTEYTENGELPYYLDANGRYEDIETLRQLLGHAEKIGALDQLVIVEAPFPGGYQVDVSELPVRIAADETAATAEGAREAIQMGYGAIALKPIAKTLSMTMKIIQVAHEAGIPCFCSDLTVNPILVEWNKNVAARLHPFPGFKTGLMETNGHQYYANWEQMGQYHPCADAPWREVHRGVFDLGKGFYEKSGCIFQVPEHYWRLVNPDTD